MRPEYSNHFKKRQPSAIRLAQIEFSKREDKVLAINTAIGNVTLPLHPALQKRMFNLGTPESPFRDGAVKYTKTVGEEETRKAFLNIIEASNFDTKGLMVQITDGGSQAMELVILGCCGRVGEAIRSLMVIDAAYTNYKAMADRLGCQIVSIIRTLDKNGKFSLPDFEKIKEAIKKNNPNALLVIPYDNPTGHFCDQETMIKLGEICVENNIWLISDEAYRELYYLDKPPSSVWGITEKDVPGITGRRISIESASKVWNGCGLRIGAIVTDNGEFHEKSVAENTANLCSSAIGQYIFGALALESKEDLQKWFLELRNYYKKMLTDFTGAMREILPGIIVSQPEASIYSVIDVRNIVDENFDARDFVLYCAQKGKVEINGQEMTLLVAPMDGFYNIKEGEENPGKKQMRLAYVLKEEEMKLVPELFVKLFQSYRELCKKETN